MINKIDMNQIIPAAEVVIGVLVIWAGVTYTVKVLGKRFGLEEDTIFMIKGLMIGCILGACYEYISESRQYKVVTIEHCEQKIDLWTDVIDHLWKDLLVQWKDSGLLIKDPWIVEDKHELEWYHVVTRLGKQQISINGKNVIIDPLADIYI